MLCPTASYGLLLRSVPFVGVITFRLVDALWKPVVNTIYLWYLKLFSKYAILAYLNVMPITELNREDLTPQS